MKFLLLMTMGILNTGLACAQTEIPKKSLIEVKVVKYEVGWFDLLINSCPEGRSVTLDGEKCEEYIFAHAPSVIVYDIPPAATHFTAVGLCPEGLENPGTWTYRVKIDTRIVFESRSLQTYPKKQVLIEVAIPRNSKKIELCVDEMKDIHQDFSIWAKPRFEARPEGVKTKPAESSTGPGPGK